MNLCQQFFWGCMFGFKKLLLKLMMCQKWICVASMLKQRKNNIFSSKLINHMLLKRNPYFQPNLLFLVTVIISSVVNREGHIMPFFRCLIINTTTYIEAFQTVFKLWMNRVKQVILLLAKCSFSNLYTQGWDGEIFAW